MTRLIATIGIGILSFVYAASIVGCEDASAKERDQVQAQLTKVGNDLQLALAASSSEEPQTLIGKLNGIVGQLNSISGGHSGQQAAKSLQAATALREIADARIRLVNEIAAENRRLRNSVRTELHSLLMLHAATSGRESIDVSPHREQLRTDLQSALTQIQSLRSRMNELTTPIGEQSTLNEDDVQQVQELRLEVGRLLKTAQERGYSDGFDAFKQATEISRQADQIEYRIAQREIELDYNLSPDHDWILLNILHLESMSEGIQASLNELDSFASTIATESTASRSTMDAVADEINELIVAIRDNTQGAFAEEFDSALTALQKAARETESAIRNISGDDADAARLTAARTYETLGRLHSLHAFTLADHASLLTQLSEASTVIHAFAEFTDDLDDVSASRNEAITAAQEAYDKALGLLDQVRGRANKTAADMYKNNLSDTAALQPAVESEEASEPADDESMPE